MQTSVLNVKKLDGQQRAAYADCAFQEKSGCEEAGNGRRCAFRGAPYEVTDQSCALNHRNSCQTSFIPRANPVQAFAPRPRWPPSWLNVFQICLNPELPESAARGAAWDRAQYSARVENVCLECGNVVHMRSEVEGRPGSAVRCAGLPARELYVPRHFLVDASLGEVASALRNPNSSEHLRGLDHSIESDPTAVSRADYADKAQLPQL